LVGGGLEVRFHRTDGDGSTFGGVEIFDEEIEVHLFGYRVAGPVRWAMVGYSLDGQHDSIALQGNQFVGFVADSKIE
jgi:hypothetical protein